VNGGFVATIEKRDQAGKLIATKTMSELFDHKFHIWPFIRLMEQMSCFWHHLEAIDYTGCVSTRCQGSCKTNYTYSRREAAMKE
jgi:hypothetical protein